MDPLHLSIALGPLAVYFLVLGLINISPRPFVTTGGRDFAALALAISGLVAAGPMELFFPERSAATFGWYVWVMLLALYFLIVVLICLTLRPRLVIYNITADELRELLNHSMLELDAQASWTGDTLMLPNLGVQAHLEPFSSVRNVQLVASGPRQSQSGWKRLELQTALLTRNVRMPRNVYGFSQLAFAALMLGTIVLYLARRPDTVAQSLEEMLRW